MFALFYYTLLKLTTKIKHIFREEKSIAGYIHGYITKNGIFRIIGYFFLQCVKQKNVLQGVL